MEIKYQNTISPPTDTCMHVHTITHTYVCACGCAWLKKQQLILQLANCLNIYK